MNAETRFDPPPSDRSPAIRSVAIPPRRRWPRLTRVAGRAAALLGLALLIACAGAAVAQDDQPPPGYRLRIDHPDWAERPDAAQRMIAGSDAAGEPVWRQVPPHSDRPLTMRVIDEATDKTVRTETVKVPAHQSRAVVFDPAAGDLAVSEDAWHLFTYDPPGSADAVAVAGSFNGWSTDAHRMTRRADGIWQALVRLDEGVHHYKFVVNGEQWTPDPEADPDLNQPDNYGGHNSGVFIGVDGRDLPTPKPEAIHVAALHHDPTDPADLNVVSASMVRLSVRTQTDDVQRVDLHLWPTGVYAERERIPMTAQPPHMGFTHWTALVQRAGLEQADYLFVLRDGERTVHLGASGVHDEPIHAVADAFSVEMTPTFPTPAWAKHAVWYQIFPERFRNGDRSNDPGDKPYENLLPWTSDWWAIHTEHGEVPGEENFYTGAGNVWQRRYGGDLQGVREKLPYLRELGINAIYFNPIFEANSMHKYDGSDFRHIDDNLGAKGDWPVEGETNDPETWTWTASDKVFLDLLDEAHRQGFHIIIDGVFNHVGRAHPYFQDVLAKGKNSQYADWFQITDWGDPKNWRPMDDPMEVHGQPGGIQWHAWDGDNGHLPTFRKDPELGLAPGPRQHIFDITRRWMDPDGDGDPSDGIDGWRLDVPGDIPHPFWRDWRELVKSINPDALVVGEIWSWAHPWLRGDQFDAVMNYQFAMPALDFFADQRTALTPDQFTQRMQRVVNTYPFQVALSQLNLYDSHDTDRLASMFVNPDRPYDQQNRLQDGADYDISRPKPIHWRRMMQAVTFQHTFVGAPMTYYGNEAGMWGPDDPSDRMPMIWQDLEPYDDPKVRFHDDLFEHFQRVIAIRHSVPLLRLGDFQPVHIDNRRGLLVFRRTLNDRHVHIAVNRSDQSRKVEIEVASDAAANGEPRRWFDLMNPDHARVIAPTDDGPPDARPTVELRQDAAGHRARDGRLSFTLDPYRTAVLVRAALLD